MQKSLPILPVTKKNPRSEAERPSGLVIKLEKTNILTTDVQQLPYAKMECNFTKSKQNQAKAEHCALEDASHGPAKGQDANS